jgi:hypothetical protein
MCSGILARESAGTGAGLVGRSTRSLPLSHSNELPVYVARVPAAPFCETPLAQGDFFAFLGSSAGFT